MEESRDKYANTEISMKDLGKIYGVCAQTVCNAVNHKTQFK